MSQLLQQVSKIKPSTQGRKANTGFGSSAPSSRAPGTANTTKEEPSFKANHSSRNTEASAERTQTTKDDDIPSFIRNREERRSRRTRR